MSDREPTGMDHWRHDFHADELESRMGCPVCEKAAELESRAPVEPPVLSAVVNLVNEQAEDEGLWFEAQTMPEAYLQQELRRLHAVIENSAPPVLSRQFLDSLIATHVTATATLYEQNVGIDGDLTRGAERLRDAILESLSQEDASE